MSRIKDLKTHAKHMVWVTEEMNDEDKRQRRYEWEREEIRAEYYALCKKGIEKGFTTAEVTHYMEEYKQVPVGGMKEWMERE